MPINVSFSKFNKPPFKAFTAYPIIAIKGNKAILSVPANKGHFEEAVELSNPDFTFCFGIRMDEVAKICHKCEGIATLYPDEEANPLFSQKSSHAYRSSQCTYTKVLANIKEALDKQYALTQDANVSESANALYQQLYDHDMCMFTTAGFEIVRSPETNKHNVEFKEKTEQTHFFD